MTRTSPKTMESKRTKSTQVELKKLKALLPTLKQKASSSPIEIVMETIYYIRQLEEQLLDRFQMDLSVQSPLSELSTISTDTSLSSIPFQDIGNSSD